MTPLVEVKKTAAAPILMQPKTQATPAAFPLPGLKESAMTYFPA